MISPYPKCLIHPKQCNQPTPLAKICRMRGAMVDNDYSFDLYD